MLGQLRLSHVTLKPIGKEGCWMARTEAQAMLRVARRDLRAARLLAVDEADEASWGFQMQQAIEKAFLAWI